MKRTTSSLLLTTSILTLVPGRGPRAMVARARPGAAAAPGGRPIEAPAVVPAPLSLASPAPALESTVPASLPLVPSSPISAMAEAQGPFAVGGNGMLPDAAPAPASAVSPDAPRTPDAESPLASLERVGEELREARDGKAGTAGQALERAFIGGDFTALKPLSIWGSVPMETMEVEGRLGPEYVLLRYSRLDPSAPQGLVTVNSGRSMAARSAAGRAMSPKELGTLGAALDAVIKETSLSEESRELYIALRKNVRRLADEPDHLDILAKERVAMGLANRYLADHGRELGLPKDEAPHLESITVDGSQALVVFARQARRHVPVEATEIVLHVSLEKGKVISSRGGWVRGLRLSAIPKIGAAEATEALSPWPVIGEPELVILPLDGRARLAWKARMGTDHAWDVYVDARNRKGAILSMRLPGDAWDILKVAGVWEVMPATSREGKPALLLGLDRSYSSQDIELSLEELFRAIPVLKDLEREGRLLFEPATSSPKTPSRRKPRTPGLGRELDLTALRAESIVADGSGGSLLHARLGGTRLAIRWRRRKGVARGLIRLRAERPDAEEEDYRALTRSELRILASALDHAAKVARHPEQRLAFLTLKERVQSLALAEAP